MFPTRRDDLGTHDNSKLLPLLDGWQQIEWQFQIRSKSRMRDRTLLSAILLNGTVGLYCIWGEGDEVEIERP